MKYISRSKVIKKMHAKKNCIKRKRRDFISNNVNATNAAANGNDSMSFADQVNLAMQLFERWNECERTVVMYALLQRLQYPSLKFLQYTIVVQVRNYLDKHHGGKTASEFDMNANSLSYLQNLFNSYTQTKLPNFLRENSLQAHPSLHQIYIDKNGKESAYSKDDVLVKFLNLMPMLIPSNTECKRVYITLIQAAVQDVVHGEASSELVQQLLSYSLIHSALTNEDRNALNVCVRCLERHLKIHGVTGPNNAKRNHLLSKSATNFDLPASGPSVPSNGNNQVLNNWQIIAPPKKSLNTDLEQATKLFSSLSIEATITEPLFTNAPKPFEKQLARADFERNGNEVMENDQRENENNQPSTSKQAQMNTALANFNANNLEELKFDRDAILLNLRAHSMNPDDFTKMRNKNPELAHVEDNIAAPVSPLTNFNANNKPRSQSLTFESQHDLLSNKPICETTENEQGQPKIGMSGIGLWLKSLRLHKYLEIFRNMSFENMLKVNEQFLLSIGVTKGASHKLSICIEKLTLRANTLMHMEQELLAINSKENKEEVIKLALDELISMSLSPMKPINEVHTQITGEINLAQVFLKNINLVLKIIQTERKLKDGDEIVNIAIYLVERALSNDAFAAQITALRKMKTTLLKIKGSVPTQHYHSRPYGSYLFGKKVRY